MDRAGADIDNQRRLPADCVVGDIALADTLSTSYAGPIMPSEKKSLPEPTTLYWLERRLGIAGVRGGSFLRVIQWRR